mgnify:CR=1 FL=1
MKSNSNKYLHTISSEYFVFELNSDPTKYSFSIRALDHFTERLICFELVYDDCVKSLNHLHDIRIHLNEAEFSFYSNAMLEQYIILLEDAKELRMKVAHYLDENFRVSLFFFWLSYKIFKKIFVLF